MAGLAQTCSGHGSRTIGLALWSAHLQDSAVLPSDDLASLLIAIASGDRVAFRRLYDSVGPKLFAIIRRINRDAAGSEEILQDVFLRVWNNAGSFSPDAGSAMAWLITIARNRAIDVFRQSRVAPFDIDGGSRALQRHHTHGGMPVHRVGLQRQVLLCGFHGRQKLLGES